MKTINTTILIDAPVATVWKILMDQQAYPQWNPFIKQLQGDLTTGKTIEATIQPPGQKAMRFTPRVKVNQAEIVDKTEEVHQTDFLILQNYLIPKIC